MSALLADTGNGATFTTATSAISLAIKDIDPSAIEIASMSAGVLATSGYDEMAPSDLKKPFKVTMTFLSNGTIEEPPIGQNPDVTRASGEAYKGETGTLTYPLVGGSGTAGKWVGTGYFESFKPSKFVNGAWQEGQLVWQYDGVTGPTYTAQA